MSWRLSVYKGEEQPLSLKCKTSEEWDELARAYTDMM